MPTLVVLRPLSEQFAPTTVTKIRELEQRYADLRITFHPSRYFIVELVRSLEAGNLLAALILSFSAIEMIIRETVIKSLVFEACGKLADALRNLPDTVDREVEEARSFSFARLVSELQISTVLSEDECSQLTALYARVRVPLHHGLAGRYVRLRGLEFEEEFGCSRTLRGKRFEGAIEDYALNELSDVLSATELVVRRGRSLMGSG